MGNSLGGKKKKIAKVMKVDGTTLRMKPPANAVSVLRDHPGYTLLEAEEVKRLGVRAPPLDPEAPLLPGKLYFLVELPRTPSHRTPRRAWSGGLQVSAKERLESLRLTRRSLSDLSFPAGGAGSGSQSPNIAAAEETKDGGLRLRMRLPKAEVEKLMSESKDGADAARRIMQLCAAKESAAPTPSPSVMSSPEPATPTLRTPRTPRTPRTEKRTRFVALPDEIIA